MTDEEFIKILRIGDEAISLYAADRIEALRLLLGKAKRLLSVCTFDAPEDLVELEEIERA